MDWSNDRDVELEAIRRKYVSYGVLFRMNAHNIKIIPPNYSNFSSFFQSVCVLGYCLTPLAISLIICRMILVVDQTNFTFFLRLATSTAGFVWATYGKSEEKHYLFVVISN